MISFSSFLKSILGIFPFAAVFIASLFHPYDPDLGWHLKYGEYLVKTGHVLRENILSTDMPTYHWANSSWLSDVVAYIIYNSFGFLGIAVLGAFIVTLTFFFFSKAYKLDYFEKVFIFPLLVYLLTSINIVSFKTQHVSLLLTGILFYALRLYEDGKKIAIYFVVPIFLVWINMHAQFILGLILFYFWMVLDLVRDYLENRVLNWGKIKTFFIVSVLSLVATLINPFGFELHKFALSHFENENLKYIMEYLPQEELSINWWKQLFAGLLIFLGSIFVVFSGQFVNRLTSLVAVPLYFISFFVRRYLWTTYFLVIPLMQPFVSFLKPESKKWQLYSGTVIILAYIFLTFIFDNPFGRVKNMSWESYCKQYQSCSPDAAEFISKNNLASDKLLTFYDWGGWLIWNYPNVKPSIDGRMVVWKDETGYSAFAYYYPYEQNLKDIDSSKYNAVFMSPKKPVYKRLIELVDENKWRLMYEDDYAGIFIRNELR